MSTSEGSPSRAKRRLSTILHPVPVFFIVTTMSAVVYGLLDIRGGLDTGTSLGYSRISHILNILLPFLTGLVAALGAYFWFSGDSGAQASPEQDTPYTPDERVRAIVRHLPVAVLSFDRKGRLTSHNPAATDLFSVTSPQDLSRITEFMDSTGFSAAIPGIYRGNTVAEERTAVLPGSADAPRTLRVTGIPITREERVVEALFLLEDITQLRLLEEQLIRSEDRYRNIFNHAPCGIFFVDRDGRYLDANPAALDMLGYTLEEITSLTTRELSADSDRRIRKLTETTGWVDEETHYLRKDGKIVEAELSASSFRSGSETYFIGIAKDVTAKRELERQLATARSRLKALLSLESRPLLLVDSMDRIANVNAPAADLLRCEPDTLLGLPLSDIIQGDPPPIQEASSASPSPFRLSIPHGPTRQMNMIRLGLGDAGSSGSLLLLS